MRNQAFVLAACAAVVIGCGGGGSNHRRSVVTPTPGSGMGVNLDSSFGRVEVAYLTGQGRAVDDYYLEITRQTIANGDGVDVQIRDSIAPLNLRLDGFQTLTARINVPFPITTVGPASSRNFSQLLFDPNRLLKEDANGRLLDTGTDLTAGGLPVTLDARVRAFPGRATVVQLRVSSATFVIDPSTGAFSFDEQLFKDLNYSNTGTDPDGQNRVASRFSDFIRFPLANVPVDLRPDLRNGFEDGEVIVNGAQYVYFSGDNVALSSAAGGQGSIFQEVGDVFTDVLLGKWSDSSAGGFRGTYDLRDALPSDETGTARLVSILGDFRDYNQVLTGGTTFEIVMFPNSGETYSFEGDDSSGVRGRLGDIVAFVRNGNNQITNIYYGGVDLNEKTFELFPIHGLGADPADPDTVAARITGTITDLRDSSGGSTVNHQSVRSFSYSFNSNGQILPDGFTTSGNVTVFRK